MTPLLGPTFQLEEMSSSPWGRSDIGRLATVTRRHRTKVVSIITRQEAIF